MKHGFIFAFILLFFSSPASGDAVSEAVDKFMSDGCLSLDEIQVLETMSPTVSDGIRPLSSDEIRLFNAVMGKDMTKAGTLKIYVSFFTFYNQVRIFALNDKGCYVTGGMMSLSGAKTFLQKGL